MADNPPVSPPPETAEPQAGPGPLPMGVGVMRVQKQRYRDWIAAGGTPPIYS